MGPGNRLPAALAFALAAALGRLLLPAVKSRYHVYAFVLLALAAEGSRRRPSARGWLLNCACATLAIVAVKLALDRRIHLPRSASQAIRLLMPR